MATSGIRPNLKHRSREITAGPERAPARAMLLAMGLSQDDLDKPFISIAPAPTLREGDPLRARVCCGPQRHKGRRESGLQQAERLLDRPQPVGLLEEETLRHMSDEP